MTNANLKHSVNNPNDSLVNFSPVKNEEEINVDHQKDE